MKDDILPNGPFEVELIVYVTDGDKGAQATYGMPKGKWPTKEAVKEAMQKTLEQMRKEYPEREWRLCTKREFFNCFAPGFAFLGNQEFID